MPDPEREPDLRKQITDSEQLVLDGLEYHTHEAEVHELPWHMHRVNHDTFIDDTHAASVDDDGVVVQLGPFTKRFPGPPDVAA